MFKKVSDSSRYLNSEGIEEGVFSDGEDKIMVERDTIRSIIKAIENLPARERTKAKDGGHDLSYWTGVLEAKLEEID